MKIAIIGAGASGLICACSTAIKAKENNSDVEIILFESKDKPGRKLLATGNGRCNLMNQNEGDYYFDSHSFSSYALKRFNVSSNLSFFNSIGLYTRSDEEGRIYPLSNQASSVLDALRFACESNKVKFITDCTVTEIKRNNGTFLINNTYTADKIVLACGGRAGAKSFFGYELLKSMGHSVTSIRPSLTKLEVKDKKQVKQLKGIRQKGEFSLFDGTELIAKEKGEILFTDYGLSGIAIMQLSAFAVRYKNIDRLKIQSDFVSELSYNELFEAVKSFAAGGTVILNENLLSGFVPKRLGEIILKSLDISLSSDPKKLSDKDLKAITSKMKKFTFEISSAKGFEDAQVTAGGADTALFNPETMESKKVKGLYCIGELLDVDGLCGGYNLHWAWSSGRLCAESMVNELLNRKG